MPKSIHIFKPGKMFLGTDLVRLHNISKLSMGQFAVFMGKPTNYIDFKFETSNTVDGKKNKLPHRNPLKTPTMAIMCRYLFQHLDEFERAELKAKVAPHELVDAIHNKLHVPGCPYENKLTNGQVGALFGMSARWGRTLHARAKGSILAENSETLMRASTVLMNGIIYNGMDALSEWYECVKIEAQLRGFPDAVNEGFNNRKNISWFEEMVASNKTEKAPKKFNVTQS